MRFRRRSTLLALLCIPAVAASAQSRAGIARLNDAVVFDLFMNYELTEKNGRSILYPKR